LIQSTLCRQTHSRISQSIWTRGEGNVSSAATATNARTSTTSGNQLLGRFPYGSQSNQLTGMYRRNGVMICLTTASSLTVTPRSRMFALRRAVVDRFESDGIPGYSLVKMNSDVATPEMDRICYQVGMYGVVCDADGIHHSDTRRYSPRRGGTHRPQW